MKPFFFLLERSPFLFLKKKEKSSSGEKRKKRERWEIIEIDELLAIHQCDEL
ncbi:MAG: hypothetical protein AB1485_08240 [Candidatus Thermoplasmatota archaeon]